MPRGLTNFSYPPHLALMKVEIQAKGWFFICSLDFFASFFIDGKKKK